MMDQVFYYLGMLVFAWFMLGTAIALVALAWERGGWLINRLEWKTPRTIPRTTA